MLDDLFSQLPDTELRTIQTHRGEVIFRQGDATSGLFQVVAGSVTLQRTTEDGSTLTLHRSTQTEYFAEASIFSETYHCNAICTEAGEVQKISKTSVTKMMETNKEFSREFTKHLAIQVQMYRAHVELLAIRSAKDRILAAMQTNNNTSTIIELASRINLTHETCYRAFKTLCSEGRMRRTGQGKYELL